ncbi:hypothetical protein [Burkholderia gladioli]|uniref:hypothetical protein n=1 Tax=Burkholderia gladioli TaxID=28095 RepID=UPI001641177B|nr:hypothetical protein [Burkholderia gladioli]
MKDGTDTQSRRRSFLFMGHGPGQRPASLRIESSVAGDPALPNTGIYHFIAQAGTHVSLPYRSRCRIE